MDLPKFHANERVDIGDIEFLSSGILGEFQRSFAAVISGSALRVVDGFAVTNGDATHVTVTRGVAGSIIAAQNASGTTIHGQLLSEGAADVQTTSLAGLTAATYGVWVRFVYGDGDEANRVFWDQADGEEKIQLVTTRQKADWRLQVAVAAPGSEWILLANAVWNGAAITSLVDKRAFLFEGPADSTPAFTPSWGTGTNDRNANRALYGVKTLERFAEATLKKIEEIQSSSARWWDATVEPLDKKVSRFGDLTLTGNYSIAGILNITGTNPQQKFPIGSPTGIGKLHFYDAGAEATQFFDFGYDAGANYAFFNTGSVGKQYRFQVVGSDVAVLSDSALDLFVPLVGPEVLPTSDMGGSLGLAGQRWGEFYAMFGEFYANLQMPSGQAALLARHQQNAIVVRGTFDAQPGTPVVASFAPSGDHWNISTIAKSGFGQFRVHLDQPISPNSTVAVTCGSGSGVQPNCVGIVYAVDASGTYVDIRTVRATDGTLDDGTIVHVAVIGRPFTLQ